MGKPRKSSNKTKQDILTVAERLFKTHCYDSTTVQMIADEVGISVGTLTYHYTNKYKIAHELFSGYISGLYQYVRKNLTENFNYYLFHCTVGVCFYREILKNQKAEDLFHHPTLMDMWKREDLPAVEAMFREISDDFKKEFSDEDCHMAAAVFHEALDRFYKEYTKADGVMTIDKYCYHHVCLWGRLAGLDEATIQKNTKRAFDFADSHDIPPIFSLE